MEDGIYRLDAMSIMARLLVTEEDYDSAECHWCGESGTHTDGCPGEEARALLARLGAGEPPKATIIAVNDGLAEVVHSTVPVEILDFDVNPGVDEDHCTCGDHNPENRPHSHTVTKPTVTEPNGKTSVND